MAVRIHALAKELETTSKDLMAVLRSNGIRISSHLSSIHEDIAEQIRRNMSDGGDSGNDASTAEKPSANEVSSVDALAFMGGTTRTSSSPDFQGGDLLAIMGGCEVDLRQANILHGPAVIDAFALWGGVEIKVPKDWSVTVKGIPVIGAYSAATSEALASPRWLGAACALVLTGWAAWGLEALARQDPREPRDLLKSMGALLRRLLIATTAMALLPGGTTALVAGALLLLGYPVSHALRRVFPPS